MPGGAGGGGWSPLSGACLEEMVREATRLAAQLEQCHLPPRDPPGPSPGPPGTHSPHSTHSPRSPRRQTFVVKDSPVRALLPTVPAPASARTPAKPRGGPAATSVPSTPKVGGTQCSQYGMKSYAFPLRHPDPRWGGVGGPSATLLSPRRCAPHPQPW